MLHLLKLIFLHCLSEIVLLEGSCHGTGSLRTPFHRSPTLNTRELPVFFGATAVMCTCDQAGQEGLIDVAYLMMRSTHPMCHSAKQVNSLQEQSPKTAVAAAALR